MDLRQKVLHGMSWLAGAKLLSQIFTWVVTLVIVRLLSPGDYGLMALAMLIITFLNVIAELGMGAAIIQRKDLNAELTRQCFGMVILLNFVLFGLVYISADTIALFFNEMELSPVIQLMAVSFLITAFSIVPEALLERELNFKKKSMIDLGSAITGSIVTLIMAINGYGVWSLVWGKITTVSIKAIGLNIIHPYLRAPSFRFTGLHQIISFSTMVTAERSIWFLYTQADTFILGKLFGKELLGIYSIAVHLASLPMQKLSGIINQVAFPAFSSIQSDKDKIAHYVLKIARLMSLATFPIFWGLSSVSPELVLVLLTDKWQEAILPLQLLTLIMPIRMISNIISPVLRGIGRADIALTNLMIAATIMPVSFYVGSEWGVLGVCYAWLISFPIVFLIIVGRAIRTFEVSLFKFLGAMVKPIISAIGMYAVIAGTRLVLPFDADSAISLAILIIVGALTYGTLITLLANDLRHEIMGLIRKSS